MQQARYSKVAMTLHWLIAVLVIVNWQIPERLEGLSHEEFMDAMWPHKALGLIIFVLVLLRLAWRLAHKPPALAATLRPWERALARSVHWAFYVLLLAMPVIGYVANSFDDGGVNIFGLFTVPGLPVQADEHFAHEIYDVHAVLGTILLILIAVHALGSLKHTFLDKDGNLFRMLPWGTPRA